MWFVAGARGARDHDDNDGRRGNSDRRTHNLLPAATARSLPRRQGGGTLDNPRTYSPRHRTSQAESGETIVTHQQPSIYFIRLQPPLLIVTKIATVFSLSLYFAFCISPIYPSVAVTTISLPLSLPLFLSPSTPLSPLPSLSPSPSLYILHYITNRILTHYT